MKQRTEWEPFPEGIKATIGVMAAVVICVILIAWGWLKGERHSSQPQA